MTKTVPEVPQRVLYSVCGSTAKDWHQHANGGGWVYKNATVEGSAYLHPTSIVSGDAWISGNARISGNAWIYGDARIYGNARISGDARIYGNAWKFSPLYVQGSRHALTLCSRTQIAIGCQVRDISYWLEHYKGIGKNEGYTKEQIAEYGKHIQYIADYAKTLQVEE